MLHNSSVRKLSRIAKSIVLLSIFSGFFFLGLFILNSIFVIQNIVIKGYSDKAALRGLYSLAKKNILTISPKEIEKAVLEANPQLQSVAIRKQFPSTLIIDLKIQPVVAELAMNNGYAYLSENGHIISKNREQKKRSPLINYYQKLNYSSYSAGDEVGFTDLLTGLHFLKSMNDLGLRTDTIDINGFDMLLFTLGDKKIFFTTEKNKETQDYELNQIIRQFKIEGREFTSLDLRFEKPIIRF